MPMSGAPKPCESVSLRDPIMKYKGPKILRTGPGAMYRKMN